MSEEDREILRGLKSVASSLMTQILAFETCAERRIREPAKLLLISEYQEKEVSAPKTEVEHT